MINETYTAIAVVAISSGAFLSTWVGFQKQRKTNPEEKYDINQFMSSFIIALIAGFGSINYEGIANQIQTIGYIGTALAYVIAGFLLDKTLSNLDSRFFSTLKRGNNEAGREVGRQNMLAQVNAIIEMHEWAIEGRERELLAYEGMKEEYPKMYAIMTPLLKQQLEAAKLKLAKAHEWKAKVMSDYGWANLAA